MTAQRAEDPELTGWALRAGRGDRMALEEFLRAAQPHVWRFVAALDSPRTADDLTQETFLRVLSGLPNFRGDSSARTWVLAIARRVVADHIRAAQARPRTTGADWQAVADSVVTPERLDEQVVLDELVAALDEDRRTAFVLTQTLGLSYADAAEVCGCPVGTIRSRVARAREDLLAALAGRSTRYPLVG